MFRTTTATWILALSLLAAPAYAQQEPNCPSSCPVQSVDPNSVEAILNRLEIRATDLKFYQCKLDYVFKQPLLESQTRREGTLSYAKLGGRSYLRIDFNTLQYDQEEAQAHKEQFIFDGIWGTYIDYQSHSVQRQQVAEPNAPVDAFALVSRRVPVLGFSKIEDLQKQFEIQRADKDAPASASSYQLHLKVKPDSAYHDEYVTIDVQIDRKRELPTRIVAVTTEEDVHEIKLMAPKINQPVAKAHFEIEIPREFSIENIPLKRSGTAR